MRWCFKIKIIIMNNNNILQLLVFCCLLTACKKQLDSTSDLLADEQVITGFGAIADDGKDDTDAIQKAIDAIHKKGGGVLVVPEGIFDIDTEKSVKMKSNVTLKMEANSWFRALPTDKSRYYIIYVGDVENVTITGGNLQGDRNQHLGVGGEWGMGIGIYGATKVTLENINIFDCWGDGICIAKNKAKIATKIRLENVKCSNNRRQGLSIIAADGVEVEKCHFTRTNGTAPQAGIDIEPDGDGTVRNVSIRNCLIDYNNRSGIVIYGRKGKKNIDNIKIQNNRILNNNYWAGYILGDQTHISIRNVVFTNNIFKGNLVGRTQQADKVEKEGKCANCTITPNQVLK